MLKFLKSIAMLSLFQSVNSNQGFKFIEKFVLDVSDWHVVLESIKTPLYYNPVDEDWKRDKCSSLGFTYKKTISRQIFTPFMIPVDKFFDVRSMYIVLSEFICGDQTLSQRFMRNILENLKINQEIQSLFETNQLFEQFINETVLIIDRDKPIDEECPICCENADITLWDCNHPICKICFEKCLIKRKKTCPLCRSVYKNITSNEEYCFAIFSFLKLISKEIKHNLGWNKTYSDSYTQTEEYFPEKVPIDTSGQLSSGGHGENIYRTFPFRDMSSTVFKRTPSPRIKELIEKYDNFFYDKDLNSSTNAVHNRNVLIKTFDFGDQCDQKIKIQIDTKKPRSSIYDIYRTLPFRDMSLSVFKTTPSSRLSKLIEKFDNFFYVKSLNLSTNAVHNNGVLKSKFSFEDQYDKKEAHFNVQPN